VGPRSGSFPRGYSSVDGSNPTLRAAASAPEATARPATWWARTGASSSAS